jgi:hypothetical protein
VTLNSASKIARHLDMGRAAGQGMHGGLRQPCPAEYSMCIRHDGVWHVLNRLAAVGKMGALTARLSFRP